MSSINYNNEKNLKVYKFWKKKSKNWHLLGTPWRPSIGDIECYKSLSQNKLSGNILILGATPEIRDLVAQYYAFQPQKPVVVDFSAQMLQNMTTLTQRVKSENEIWVQSHWLDAPLPKNYFDLVIGDMVWWVLTHREQKEMSRKIREVLNESGLFVSRFKFQNTISKIQKPVEVVKKYLELIKKNKERSYEFGEMMKVALFDTATDPISYEINSVSVKKFLQKTIWLFDSLKEKLLLFKLAQSIQNAPPTAFINQAEQVVMSILTNDFELAHRKTADDYESGFFPVLCFKRKNTEI